MNTESHKRYNLGPWKSDALKSWWAHVYVAGSYETAEMVCRRDCFDAGLCVTIEPVRYIFTGGTEDGVRIGLIQYPPFPEDESELKQRAINLGRLIAEENAQWSFAVVTPTQNIFFSRRKNG